MKRWGKQARYSRIAAEVGGRELIREAEAIVADVWLASLAEAMAEAETATNICTHARDAAFHVFQAAESSGDPAAVEVCRRELAVCQEALGTIRRQYAAISGLADRERRSGETAARARSDEAAADRERLAAAARAAGSTP